MTAQGYSQTLEAELYEEPSEGEDPATAEVLLALAGVSFVTAGRSPAMRAWSTSRQTGRAG